MVPHISKKGKVNFLCQIGLFLGQSLPTFNYIHSLFFVFFFLEYCVLHFTFYILVPLWGMLFPSCPDCCLRAPACKSHQLGEAGRMDLKVVRAHWPSVWGQYRCLTEMILDNIQIDVLPQGCLGGLCFACVLSRPGLKIHGCTWLFVPVLCFSNILAQPKSLLSKRLNWKRVMFGAQKKNCAVFRRLA